MKTFQPQADESLGTHPHVVQVLLVRPLDPLFNSFNPAVGTRTQSDNMLEQKKGKLKF